MMERLKYPDEEHPDPRGEVDGALQVTEWPVPGVPRLNDPNVPEGAPAWWHGDEDASQSFFKAMGINPETVEAR